ncbi:hypothetical protein [Thalassotalea sp. PLHSN55]|uniref:hypothetical protein n=1 Tax=Thalassotalea sp. PLHSN55 TaxID=3435888 RepID=UPI003F8389A5
MYNTQSTLSFRLTYSALIAAVLLILLSPSSWAVSIAVHQGLADRYKMILKNSGQSAKDFTEFSRLGVSKGSATLIIIKKALELGGIDDDFEFVIVPNTLRGLEMVREGKVLMTQQRLMTGMYPEELYLSTAVIEEGEFIKGIYGLADNKALMQVDSLDDLKNLTAATQYAWLQDIKTLESIPPKSLHLASNFNSLLKVIKFRGIDFTLLEFAKDVNKPKFNRERNVELFPVPNVAIAIDSSRHYMVSKKHPEGAKVIKALNKGLAQLRSKGLIQKYYGQARVLRPDLAHFKILNKDEK